MLKSSFKVKYILGHHLASNKLCANIIMQMCPYCHCWHREPWHLMKKIIAFVKKGISPSSNSNQGIALKNLHGVPVPTKILLEILNALMPQCKHCTFTAVTYSTDGSMNIAQSSLGEHGGIKSGRASDSESKGPEFADPHWRLIITTLSSGYTQEALWLHPDMTEKLLTRTLNLKTIKGFHDNITNLNNNIWTTTSKCIHVGSVLGCSRLVFNVHKHT